ncbi:MAG: ribonuclease III [Alphaproteobacteria bacterium]
MTLTSKTIQWIEDLSQKILLDKKLFRKALTHDSISKKAGGRGKSNERLEFLGDRILGLVIAESLFKLYPKEKEGDLARRLAWLASKDVLSKVALNIHIDEHILMSFAEEKSGGRENPAILSDAVEALIAYFYLEYGLSYCSEFINKHWYDFIHEDSVPQDSKSALQEWAQKNGFELPVYKKISHSGPDHDPEFIIEVSVGTHKAEAKASSKKKAERIAAEILLEQVNLK